MLKAKDGDFFITDWLRNGNTLDYIAIWEEIHNPNFNYGEFATIRMRAGSNSFKIGIQEFVERTNAISLISSAGRYGGTYAHKDIAFEAKTKIGKVINAITPDKIDLFYNKTKADKFGFDMVYNINK